MTTRLRHSRLLPSASWVPLYLLELHYSTSMFEVHMPQSISPARQHLDLAPRPPLPQASYHSIMTPVDASLFRFACRTLGCRHMCSDEHNLPLCITKLGAGLMCRMSNHTVGGKKHVAMYTSRCIRHLYVVVCDAFQQGKPPTHTG